MSFLVAFCAPILSDDYYLSDVLLHSKYIPQRNVSYPHVLRMCSKKLLLHMRKTCELFLPSRKVWGPTTCINNNLNNDSKCNALLACCAVYTVCWKSVMEVFSLGVLVARR